MKIIHKSILIVTVMLLFLIIFGNFLFGVFFNKYLLQQEDDQITIMNDSVISYFQERENKYIGAVCDWAWWDDAYNYIENQSTGFAYAYFTEATFVNNDINLLLMAKESGEIVSAIYYDVEKERYEKPPEQLITILSQHLALYMANDGQANILKAGEKYYIIASSLVTDTNGTREPNGILVFGKEIDGAMLGQLGHVIKARVALAGQEELHIDVLRTLVERPDSEYPTTTLRLEEENVLKGHILLNEQKGTSPVILTYMKDRDIFNNGINRIRYFQVLYAAFILGLVGIFAIVMSKTVLMPIGSLANEIAAFDHFGGKKDKLKAQGRDEFALLREAINKMLDKIQDEQDNLRKSEKRLLYAQSIAHVGNWEVILDDRTIWLSDEALKILGITGRPNNLELSEFQALLHPEDYSAMYEAGKELVHGNRCVALETHYTKVDDGSGRIIKYQAEPDYDDEGRIVKLLGVSMDITSEKLKEADIVYLSHHDALTGLYNRFFLEEEHKRLESGRQLPLSVIMGDINGLKLINDAFGHAEGDILLTDTANILKQCSRSEDIIARTGGDEFCILLPNTSAETAQQICRRIYNACDEFNRKSEREISFVSISLGTGTKTAPDQCMDFVIREAEEAMYKHKLLDRKSMHSSIMTSIKATMAEKSFETQEHGDRLVRLSNRVGRALDLTDDQFNDLELLAMLHDIGKIGIDSAILAKEGPLTDDEWVEMKRHPEIGFRIAAVSPELSSISEYILCHHERWDGKGYPQGLAGDDIPILSRIITIVDSYDAMTQDRPYRKAMSKEDAVRELRKNAGTQFDPEIVDVFIRHALGEKTPKAIHASRGSVAGNIMEVPEPSELN